jgi:transposase
MNEAGLQTSLTPGWTPISFPAKPSPGVFETFFDHLAALSWSAHLIQMFDSTIVRAHISAAGAKGGRRSRRSVARAVVSQLKST